MNPEDHNQNETNAQSPTESARKVERDPPVVSDFWRALALLSRVPVHAKLDFRPELIARSVWCWPLVGLFLAGIAVLPAMLIWHLTENAVIFALVVSAAMIVLTGAMHEDGMADCADGFGGGLERGRKLAIMRDSRIGTYGVVALILCLGLRVALLASAVDHGEAVAMLMVMAVMSRAAMPALMRALPPVRDDGLGRGAGRPDWTLVFLSVLFAAGLVWLLAGFVVMVAVLIVAFGAVVSVGALAKWQIGGQTGDVLGMTQVATELCVGMAFIALLRLA